MLIGCPKEIKNHEYRVGLTPSMVSELVINNNSVMIEQSAGLGSGFFDTDYINAGATIIQEPDESLPLLAPMAEVAGRLAPQMGAWALQKANGGRGMLLGGVPGVSPANVLIIGGGVVGTQAAIIASGMGAKVTLMDNSISRLNT